ncbi:hypothetical protein NADFUDRAFT_5354, partial [Nadsonia fulvescens var. elongata DSM 6958]
EDDEDNEGIEDDEDDEDEAADEDEDGEDEDEEDHDISAEGWANALFSSRRRTINEAFDNLPSFSNQITMMSGVSSSLSHIRSLISQIKQREDETTIMLALQELGDILLVSQEDLVIPPFPLDSLCDELVALLNDPIISEHSEILLLSARNMSSLIEISSTTAANLARAGASRALCEQLLAIQYVDVAEQALSTLEKISKENQLSILRAGGLTACLQFLDFFSIHTQRSALTIAANCCRAVTSSYVSSVKEIIPILENTLQHTDGKIVEQSCLCVCRMVECMKQSTEILGSLISPEIIKRLLDIADPSTSGTISSQIRLQVLRTLSTCAKASIALSVSMVENNIGVIFYQCLLGVKPEHYDYLHRDPTALQELVHAPTEVIAEILGVIKHILPYAELASDAKFSGPYAHKLSTEKHSLNSQREEELLGINDSTYNKLTDLFFPLLVDIYSASVNLSIRQKVLQCLINFVSAAKNDVLMDILLNVELTSLISLVLSQNDHPSLVVGALELSNALLELLPEKYFAEFTREGIIDEIKTFFDESESAPVSLGAKSTTIFTMKSKLNSVINYKARYTFEIYEKLKKEDGYLIEEDNNVSFLSEISAKLLDKETADTALEMLLPYIINNDLSPYEINKSGVFTSLLRILTEGSEEDKRAARSAFLKVFMAGSGGNKPLEGLVMKLLKNLSRSENFECLTTEFGEGPNSTARSLTKQFNLRIVPDDEGEEGNLQSRNFMVSIQAIAPFKALNNVLKPKIAMSSFFSSGSSAGTNNLSSALAAFASAAETSSYADVLQPKDWHLQFFLDGIMLPYNETVYGALYRMVKRRRDLENLTNKIKNSAPLSLLEFNTKPITIKYKKVEGAPPIDELKPVTAEDIIPFKQTPVSFSDNDVISSTLRLLSIIFLLNSSIEEIFDTDLTGEGSMIPLSFEKFISPKLTSKLNVQLDEPLVFVSELLPQWTVDIVRSYQFLFPFETRHLFVQATSFGFARLMNKWQSVINSRDSLGNVSFEARNRVGNLVKQRIQVSRDHILVSAVKLLEKFGSTNNFIEVAFKDEVGTGLGPTLEFYSNVSKEFSKKNLGMWREGDNAESEHVYDKAGLFPAPMDDVLEEKSIGKSVLKWFKVLGRFVARAMLDSRIIDVSFNPMFFRLIGKGSISSSIGTVMLVDSSLGKSLLVLQNYVKEKELRELNKEPVEGITICGSTVDDLSLDFTLAGYPSINLKDNGSEIPVTIHNIEEYIALTVDMTVGSGVRRQLDSFASGFSDVFPCSSLKSFTSEELVSMFGKSQENWSRDILQDSIKADHGYTMESTSIVNLMDIMSSFEQHEQRSFLQFITGSPNLPIGGFKSLSPALTVVRKSSDDAILGSDDYLPSVMTCANYLKLPNYSTKDIMRSRIIQAIHEGSSSFLLS